MKAQLDRYSPMLMAVPTFVAMVFFAAVPLVYVVSLSLTNSTLAKPFQDFVWFEQYKRALGDEILGRSIVNTLLFAFVATALEVVLGFVLALAIQGLGKLSGLFLTLALLPLFTPPIAVAMVWRLIYDPNQGLLSHYLMQWGITDHAVALLASSKTALPAIMAADVWQWMPFTFLLSYAALQALPRDPYEAAAVDGARALQVFRRLTLPLVAPSLIVIFLFKFLIALKVFDLVFILTYGGPGSSTQVLSFYIYKVGFTLFKSGYGAALSIIVLILVSLIATVLTTGRDLVLRRQAR